MPTREEVAKQPLEQRLGRMSRTAEDLAVAIRGQSEAALVRRPDSKNWAANEVICHLRDIEEVYFGAPTRSCSTMSRRSTQTRWGRPTGSPRTGNT